MSLAVIKASGSLSCYFYSWPSGLFFPFLRLFSSRSGFFSILEHVIIGLPLAYLVLQLSPHPSYPRLYPVNNNLPKFRFLFVYLVALLVQIILGGVDVARRVMRVRMDISPGVVKFRTKLQDDLPIAINANSITLTPGTITLDVEEDDQGSTFWVHCISREGQESIKHSKGFVDKIKKIYGVEDDS